MAGLLMFAGAHASNMADRSVLQGFLSKYMGSDAVETSLGDYHKFMVHRFNNMKHKGAPVAQSRHDGSAEHGPAVRDSQQVDANGQYGAMSAATMFDKPAHPAALAQDYMAFTPASEEPLMSTKVKQEEKAVEKLFTAGGSMPIGMSAIGVSLLALAAMVGFHMWRGLRQASIFASSGVHGSDISIASAPASVDNILEMKAQESIDRGQEGVQQHSGAAPRKDNFIDLGWLQHSSENKCSLTLCYAAQPCSTTRRVALATAATLATTRRCNALQLEGEYSDPNHPNGWRKFKVEGERATITGQDDPRAPVWSIGGIVGDSTIALLVEPGSVQPPSGTTMETVDDKIVPVFRGEIVDDGIKWPDGNKWTRKR
jgi:hypothetical protein